MTYTSLVEAINEAERFLKRAKEIVSRHDKKTLGTDDHNGALQVPEGAISFMLDAAEDVEVALARLRRA